MMVQLAPISRTIRIARPPTPPRDSNANPKPPLLPAPPNLFSRLFTRTASSQADITPTSSSDLPDHGEQAKKKVAWDDSNDRLEASAQPASPERKPMKSILKPYNGNQINLGLTKLSPPHTYANLAAMLESVAQQLAGTDRDSKLDAYTTLSGVLKASENVPDVWALQDKMSLLLAFIKRDLAEKTSTGALDTTLAVNALILLSIFLHRPTVANSITAEFSIYLVEHAIKTFQDASMSKDVAKHLMLVLAEQKFSPKIMNGDRVFRLIASLHDIENHVKGKSIIMGRINIYRTLLRQSRPHMLINTDWMSDLFGDMCSTVKETRGSAITFGLEAGLVLGIESRASRAFMELFSADLGDNDVKFGDYYIRRLKSNIETKHDVACVPQIWSIPILFLRSKPRQFEQWAFRASWLLIVEQCFNCSDQQAKLEANLAWNRLVFSLQLDEKSPPQMIKLLYQPLDRQLKRKSKNKKAALGSLCNLLYYSLKPTSTSAQLDLYWDRYVVEAVAKALTARLAPDSKLELVRQDLMDACRILTGLFDSVTPRKWSETRAVDAYGKETLMDASELPALDSRWLRRNASRVFPIMASLLEQLYWDLAEDIEVITILWTAYITSIASPAIKEVKVSNETMSCIAYIFGHLFKIWQTGPKSLQSLPPQEGPLSADFLLSFGSIISKTISSLGLLPFTEKLLSVGRKDEFVVIATPSHQPKMVKGEPKCPLHHLLVLLTTVSPGLQYDGHFSQLVRRILDPFFEARQSKQTRLDLILDLLGLLPQASNEPSRMIWSVLADVATSATDTRDNLNTGLSGMNDQPLGAYFRKALRILEIGLDLLPTEPLPGWKTFFEALVTSATLDAGDSGRAIAVIEPLGRLLHSKFSNINGLSTSRSHIYYRTLFSKATYPRDRQAFDAARRKLWGTAAAKTSSFDPYSFLYEYMRETLEKSYVSFTSGLSLEYSEIITATTSFLSHCPTALLTNSLMKLQSGIAVWIIDEGSHISGATALSQSITSLWSKICQIIPNLARISDTSRLLADLEILLCSGLGSRHRSIVNSSIRLWNSTFGTSKAHIFYPEKVRDALLSIYRVTEIHLPFFPENVESDRMGDQWQLPNFANTQSDFSNILGSTDISSILKEPATRSNKMSPASSTRLLSSQIPQVLIEIAQSVPQKRSRDSTPDSTKRKSRQRNVAPKLRHDDSHVQFEAIDSSPINGGVLDSQLLTDRQKEVKERQQADAMMFPDLRSSPRQREKLKPTSDVELPLHCAASKASPELAPIRERETTPTLVPHVESDDFVNSSPTPTRSSYNDRNSLEPPSSPPEAPKQKTAACGQEDMEIPSSPPEIPQEEVDTYPTISLYPSAQVVGEEMPTLSTFDMTPNQQDAPSNPEARDPTEIPKPALFEESSKAKAQSSFVSDQSGNSAAMAPGTPARRGRDSSPSTFQTPRSELFHDARSTPASSDKGTINEDVFEDAVSSPRLDLNKVTGVDKQQQSSPISYLDESSALRIMAGYDQGSGRPRRSPRNVKFAMEQESGDLRAPTLPQQTTAKDPHPPDVFQRVPEVPEEPPLPVGKNAECSSPIPSLIPETPGPEAVTDLRVVDGQEFDLNETIVVDDSILQQNAQTPNRRKRKLDTDAIKGFVSKKGKHDEAVEESNQDPCDQDAKLEILSPKKSKFPRKHGRPKRSTRVSPLADEGPRPSLSPSFSDLEREGSVQNSRGLEAATQLAMSTANEGITFRNDEPVDKRREISLTTMLLPQTPSPLRLTPAAEDLPVGNEGELEVAKHHNGRRASESHLELSNAMIENQIMSNPDVVADTVIGGTTYLEDASSAPSNDEAETREKAKMTVSKIQAKILEPDCQETPKQMEMPIQAKVMVESPSIDGIRRKLRSIIGDLGTMALSREEMNELEDMFMDAKQLLYGAGRKGRAGS